MDILYLYMLLFSLSGVGLFFSVWKFEKGYQRRGVQFFLVYGFFLLSPFVICWARHL